MLFQEFHQGIERLHFGYRPTECFSDVDLLPRRWKLLYPARFKKVKQRVDEEAVLCPVGVEGLGFVLKPIEAGFVLKIKCNPDLPHQSEVAGGLPVGFIREFPPHLVQQVLEVGAPVRKPHYVFRDRRVDPPRTVIVLQHQLQVVHFMDDLFGSRMGKPRFAYGRTHPDFVQ